VVFMKRFLGRQLLHTTFYLVFLTCKTNYTTEGENVKEGREIQQGEGVCPRFVGLGRWPFRLAVNGQAQAKMRR